MEIKVLFFGVLAEVSGTSFKIYGKINSMDELRLRIEDDYPEMVHYKFRYSHNGVLIDNNPFLNDGDEVALLPPFAGG